MSSPTAVSSSLDYYWVSIACKASYCCEVHTFAWLSLPFGSMAPLLIFYLPSHHIPGRDLSSPLQTISFCKNRPTFPLASKFSMSLKAFPSCQTLPVFQGQVQGTSTYSTSELEAFFQLEAWIFLWKATSMVLVSSSLKNVLSPLPPRLPEPDPIYCLCTRKWSPDICYLFVCLMCLSFLPILFSTHLLSIMLKSQSCP